MKNILDLIPNQLWMKIFSEFTIKELCAVNRTCKKWAFIAQSLVKFQLNNIEKLNLFGSVVDNRLLSCILTSFTNLVYLNLEFCTNVNDEMFTLASSFINCPLEELYLSNLNISDVALESLVQIKETLRKLGVRNCKRLTSKVMAQSLDKLSNLVYFDVRNTNTDNILLKTALNFSGKRKIYLLCQNSSIDLFQFLREFQNTDKVFLNSNDVLFKHRNLSFEYSIDCI
jgi:hypothetical protein